MRRKNGNRLGIILGGILLYFITTVLSLALFLLGVMGVLLRGPSMEARRIFTLSCNETSALKFLPGWYLSQEEEDAILNPQEAEPLRDDFRELPWADLRQEEHPAAVTVSAAGEQEFGIRVEEVKGPTYKGKMMLVSDPARVVVGTLDAYGSQYEGKFLYEFIADWGAVGGTNAGGFYDPEGFGTGGIPDGIVIREGEILYGSRGTRYRNFMGLDGEGVLHVGSLTGQEAMDLGIVSGVSFPPGKTLIMDGVRQTGLGGGVNPRTAIGQRADGTMLLLVVEGRHPGSLGSDYDDLAEIMENWGAVNAGMLDGGSSSIMYYEGEQITRGSNIVGMRRLATCILVMPEEG